MKKRFLYVLFLSISILILTTGVLAVENTDNISENIWSLDENGTLTVTNESGNGEITLIPETIDVSAVTDIVFNGISTVRGGLLFGDGYKFKDCTSLKSITFNSDIDVLSGFEDSTSLESVVFNGNIDTIAGAFDGCTSLASVEFRSEGPVYIWDSSFKDCSSLARIDLGNRLEAIGSEGTGSPYGAFQGSGLVELVIPNSVTVLRSGAAFRDCKDLKSVVIPNSITRTQASMFSGCSSLENVTISDGVQAIGASTFENCTSLKTIIIPENVTTIGWGTFSGCTALENVTLSKRMPEISGETFQNCSSLKTITIPDAVTSIGANAFDGCTSLTSVTTGDFINTVGASAFDNCPRLTLHVYDGSYMQAYAEAYDLDYEIIPGTEQEVTGIENITSSTGVDPETGEVCTVITITLSDGRTQKFYLDNEVNSIEDITSRPGFDPDGKPCTVVTITMTNGDVERFYVYDGKDGEDGETVVTPAFTDVPANAYYADAVAWAVANGITGGTAENTFSPDAPCTRAQVVTFLWRAMGSPEPRSAGTFTDVNASSYYAKAVRWALENGITSGTSATTFDPNGVCTRAQVVTFLMRALDGRSYGSAGFADVAASSYYADAVAWAVANGITDGTGATTFSPDTQCNRAQIVTFLYRAVA